MRIIAITTGPAVNITSLATITTEGLTSIVIDQATLVMTTINQHSDHNHIRKQHINKCNRA